MPTIYKYTTPITVDQARYDVLIKRPEYFAVSTKPPVKVGTSRMGDPRQGGRLYGDLSPFNVPVPLGIPAHSNSANYVSRLTTAIQASGFNVAIGSYSPTVFFAQSDSPRVDVVLEGYDGITRIMRNVPIPNEAVPDPTDDGHMCILDMVRGIEYDFSAMTKINGVWHATWGCAMSTTSSYGILPYGMSARATGMSLLGGVIWPQELRAGVIDHALIFAYPYTALAGPVVPATGSDGTSALTDAMPEGSRLQLNPALDINSLNLGYAEKIIATAMQKYGMILADTGGATSIYAINPLSFPSNPYAGIWPADPAVTLANMPINHLRVLDSGPVMPKRYKMVSTPIVQIDEV